MPVSKSLMSHGVNYKEALLIGFSNGLPLTPKELEGLLPTRLRWPKFILGRIRRVDRSDEVLAVWIDGHCGGHELSVALDVGTGKALMVPQGGHLNIYELVEVCHHISVALARNGYPIRELNFPVAMNQVDPLSFGHTIFLTTDRGTLRVL